MEDITTTNEDFEFVRNCITKYLEDYLDELTKDTVKENEKLAGAIIKYFGVANKSPAGYMIRGFAAGFGCGMEFDRDLINLKNEEEGAGL